MVIMTPIGKHIRKLRTTRRLTQEDLAEKLFVTRQAVSAWETGKALPDIETLERIAEVLEADVTEVIYGVSISPDLRKTKHRWALAGAAAASLVLLFIAMLHIGGVIGTWRYGLQYQYWNQNYDVTLEELSDVCRLEVDLKNPESNTGKVLYEDTAGNRITVQRVDQAPNSGNYRIVFLAEGHCTPAGGSLVSGCYNDRTGKNQYSTKMPAVLTTTIGDTVCESGYGYTQSSMNKSENFFGFYLFSAESYRHGEFAMEEELADENGIVTVFVSGLSCLTTQRRPYLSPFS